MAFEYLILADYRTLYIYIYNRKTLWSSQLWHFLSTISHTLRLHIQSCNVFHRIVFVQKKKAILSQTFSPSSELLYISNIDVIKLIDKSIWHIRSSHSISYLNWIMYFPFICNNYCVLRRSILRLLLWFHSSNIEDKNQNPWDTGFIEVKLSVLK